MNDKKNINRLSLFASQICNGVLGFSERKRHESDGYPQKSIRFFFVTIFRKAPAFKQGINDYFDHLCIFF
jgi:hypothetical protein